MPFEDAASVTFAEFRNHYGLSRPPSPTRPAFGTRIGGLHPAAAAAAAAAPARDKLPRSLVVLVSVVVTMALVGITTVLLRGGTETAAASAFPPTPASEPTARSAAPLDYPWLATHTDGTPVTWPCGPIGYRLVLETAPPGASTLIREAAARISAVSGLQFQENPAVPNRAGADPGFRGITASWEPVESFEARNRDPDAIGSGGATHSAGRYTSGDVRLLSDWAGNMITDFAPGSAGPVLLHEFGHALGLSHLDDRRAVMNATDEGVSEWTALEVAALTELRIRCARG